MSMHEIESLMENTIRLIDKIEIPLATKRNLIWNTYNLQNQFDCSFTHFRLMDILIKNDYVQRYSLEAFPMVKSFTQFFDEMRAKDFVWIRKYPESPWSENNPEIAYWDMLTKSIYTDYGTVYYSINPKESPQEIKPLDFGKQIIEIAFELKDKLSVYDWTAFLIIYVMARFPAEISSSELKENHFKKIKVIFNSFNYSNHKPSNKGLDIIKQKDADYLSGIQKEMLSYILE